MDQLRFSIPEILSLIGVTQCVYILVYMALRAGRVSRAGLPMVYFLVLALAFVSDFAENMWAPLFERYFYFQWVAWYLGPPLSVLLVIQIAQIYRTPPLRHYRVLLLLPVAFAAAALSTMHLPGCERLLPCEEMQSGLTLTGILAGTLSLSSLLQAHGLLSGIEDKKTGKERYWLVIAIVLITVAFLAAALISLGAHVNHENFMLVRTVLGLGFVYLVGTSLFRIYPQAVLITAGGRGGKLSAEELAIAQKVEKLLTEDKVYHESTYARTDLAHECQTSEAVISKIINLHFQKSFPQIINEYRVEDAKRLLRQTEENIKIIAEEVGFSSVASFNRVFREISGDAPSAYRKKMKPG